MTEAENLIFAQLREIRAKLDQHSEEYHDTERLATKDYVWASIFELRRALIKWIVGAMVMLTAIFAAIVKFA